MSLDIVSKNKIKGYLNKRSVDELYYNEYYEALNGKKKYNDINFLTFFIETIYNVFEGKEQANVKMIEKYFESNYIFLNSCLYEKKEIDSGLIAKMLIFEKVYRKYCNDNSIEVDNDIIYVINRINGLLKECVKNESIDNSEMYNEKVQELEIAILDLKNDNSKKDDTILKLEKDLNGTNSSLEKMKKDYEKARVEYSKMKSNEDKLLKENEDLKGKLESSCLELSKKEEENVSLLAQNNELDNRIKSLNEQIDDKDRIIVSIDKEKEIKFKQEFLDNLIIELILNEKMSFDKIVKKVKIKCKDYNFEEQEIVDSISRIGKKLNIIDSEVVTIPRVYNISSPSVLTEGKLLLQPSKECMDIFLMSDLHINELDNKMVKIMNDVYEYCTSNDINTIFDLGDFFNSDGNIIEKDSEGFKKYQKLLEDVITKLPKSDGISHVIMGGNHDRDHLAYGIDPIKYISDFRNDIIYLGYDNAFVEFLSNKGKNDFFMLHHISLPRENIFSRNINDKSDEFNERIVGYYNSIGINRNNSYVDFFGHVHRSRLDVFNSSCYVPSLKISHRNSSSGAWHVKIFFDEFKKIEYMVFLPLVYQKRFYVATEQVYKKTKKL